MASVRLLRRAEAELEDAVAWHETRSPRVARRFEDAVTVALDRLGAMPEMYALVDDQHRLCPVRKSQYVIVYQYKKDIDEVVVVAVVHARRDPRTWQSGN